MKNLSKKAKLSLLALLLSLFILQIQSEIRSDVVTAGTFLGTGTEVKESECILGVKVLTKQAKLFGFNLGDSWTETESC
ncbi:hypothetical protein [Marivirga sp.]|uniref:hypothetical protein n=1 Tax=Marivirga sp. TaxID=2018662 RepID=UPI002D7F2B92|nr:hypothetical protein [Marivirga sp.]HET8861220.1 hypothetical protein [Marivirga sp.]